MIFLVLTSKLVTAYKVFRRNRIVKCWVRWRGKSLEPRKWIFIIGCYNSGTTLLEKILSIHPEISSLNDEGVMFSPHLKRPEDFGWTRMWSECYNLVRLDDSNEYEELAEQTKRAWSLFLDAAKPYLLEKSIVNAARVPFLDRFFQPAYFLYLVRDGYAVAEGIRRKAEPLKFGNARFGNQYPIALCAKQWAFTDKVIDRTRPERSRFLLVKYEALAEQPLETLSRITAFLGIPNAFGNIQDTQFKIHGKNLKIQNLNQESWEKLTPADIDEIEEVAGSVLKKHGYNRPILNSA